MPAPLLEEIPPPDAQQNDIQFQSFLSDLSLINPAALDQISPGSAARIDVTSSQCDAMPKKDAS
jgi:hypothetical protein